MIKVMLEIFRTIAQLSSNVWELLYATPAELYSAWIEKPLVDFVYDMSNKILQVGGGDRNPLTSLAYGILDETVNTWLEWIIAAPRLFYEAVLPFSLITILFGGGLIVCIGWRLVSWIIDIMP